ncbi:hypothetical protein Pint_09992 [Pistacia integerrima]|uniref:Uncharacterized protein n=1 Tax=Pistacia integerrima TaxID=434235 RepID=A0ACC0XM07_9ROSI|nr:hypothetical protein Pint_09992 [Pistacia integerrima]
MLRNSVDPLHQLELIATFLLKGENVNFKDVRSFTTSYLKAYVKDYASETCIGATIELEDAKIGGKVVHRSTHQDDLKCSSRWWKNAGPGEKLSFASDRLMENFLWTVEVIFEPEFRYCRRMSTKVNALITACVWKLR